MFAARFHPGQSQLSIENIPVPELRTGEVLLKIKAAGVCHSDLHVLGGEIPLQGVFTMGHEACGELVAKGPDVPEEYQLGALYAVHGTNPCGDCLYCRTGRDHLCDGPNRAWIGLGNDGAYSDFLKVRARNTARVPNGVSPEAAAVATDAVLTPYHALKNVANLRAGETVLIMGLGGLGMNGVQIAHALGAHVIATDLREATFDLARDSGAEQVLSTRELERKLKGTPIDLVADFVGVESTFLSAQNLVRPGGTVLLIGLGAVQVPIQTAAAAIKELRLQTSLWGTSVELRETLELIARGTLKPQVETGELRDVNHWLEELKLGHVRSRKALIPGAA